MQVSYIYFFNHVLYNISKKVILESCSMIDLQLFRAIAEYHCLECVQ